MVVSNTLSHHIRNFVEFLELAICTWDNYLITVRGMIYSHLPHHVQETFSNPRACLFLLSSIFLSLLWWRPSLRVGGILTPLTGTIFSYRESLATRIRELRVGARLSSPALRAGPKPAINLRGPERSRVETGDC